MRLGIINADWSLSMTDGDGHAVWGGSGWARIGKYIPHLQEHGFEVTFGQGVGNPRLGMGVREYLPESSGMGNFGWNGPNRFGQDVVYMHRVMFPGVADDMEKFKATGQTLLSDIDDWYWGLDAANDASMLPLKRPSIKDGSLMVTGLVENLEDYRRIMAASHAVSCSTPFLAEKMRKWCKCPVEVIPNTVDFSAFTMHEHVDGDRPTIGWAGSTSHRSGDLETMKGILHQLYADGFRFQHSGYVGVEREFAKMAGIPMVCVHPQVEPSDYPTLLNFDIGIVPLTDIPFNIAKSNIKGLEYAAAGIPFVAPHIGEYKALYEDYGVGRTARKPADWVKHLRQLRDPDVRAHEAKVNWERAQAFDISVGAKRVIEFIEAYSA